MVKFPSKLFYSVTRQNFGPRVLFPQCLASNSHDTSQPSHQMCCHAWGLRMEECKYLYLRNFFASLSFPSLKRNSQTLFGMASLLFFLLNLTTHTCCRMPLQLFSYLDNSEQSPYPGPLETQCWHQ